MTEAPRRKSRWKRRLITLVVIVAGLFAYSLQFHPEREDWAGQRAKLAQRQLAPAPARIDQAQVLGDVRTLAAPAMKGRAAGTPGGKAAREFLVARFAELQLEPAFGKSYEQPFRFVPFRGLKFWRAKFWQAQKPIDGVNVAGIVRGTVDPGHFLVVSAHFDHLGERGGKLFPGADDNASGTAAMLAAARWFKAHPPRHSILFVGFDAEERGLKGAEAFVDKPPVPLSQMLVDVNFDMLSRSKENEIFVTGLYANPQLAPMVDAARAQARPAMIYGPDHPRPFWEIMEDWTDQSDQGAFNARGIPFLYLGVADHPGYHHPSDTFENIDQAFFLNVVASILDVVDALDVVDGRKLREARPK